MPLLINISNHPSSSWSEGQKRGWDIIDVPFLVVPWDASEEDVRNLAQGIFSSLVQLLYQREKRRGYCCRQPEKNRIIIKRLCASATIHVAGEWSLFFALVSLLRSYGATIVCACSERKTVETIRTDGATQKQTIFEFKKWREIK